MTKDVWAEPQEVDDVLSVFPAGVSHLMPTQKEIPSEFERGAGGTWLDFQNHWFFRGLDKPSFYCKEGVDGALALRHLQAIQGSYAPKHEHKMAAVAYLASRWFTAVVLEDGTVFGEPPE